MPIPSDIIVTADDFGLSGLVNKAILNCFGQCYIKSASMLTIHTNFDEAVNLINQKPVIQNGGVRVNMIEGKPVTRMINQQFLDENGNRDADNAYEKLFAFDRQTENIFLNGQFAQIDKAAQAGVKITHLDSHFHLHALRRFYGLFIKAAECFKIKLWLRQTFNESNFFKFTYRNLFNALVSLSNFIYSGYFENIGYFLNYRKAVRHKKKIAVMLYTGLGIGGELPDNYDNKSVEDCAFYLAKKN